MNTKNIDSLKVFALWSTLFLTISLMAREYPQGKLGEVVRLGEDIVNHTDTNPLSKSYVRSSLQCSNCHRKGSDGRAGTAKTIGTFVGTSTSFPAYSKRHKDIISLQNRIDGCFLRCMNGTKSIVNTKVGIAVESYITWLSTGMPVKMSSKAPRTPLKIEMWSKNTKKFTALFKKASHQNYVNGKILYTNKCASCHGDDGQGKGIFPPLWGKVSYTADGSMAKLPNAATWIQDNMPLNNAHLTDEQTVAVTLYINAQQRPDYKGVTIEDNFKKLGLDLEKIKNEEKI